MELTSDFVAIQGIFINLIKHEGNLARIKSRDAHWEKIISVCSAVQNFLHERKYIYDNKIEDDYEKKVEDIIMFLLLNTEEIGTEMEDDTNGHLINIFPEMSRYLLLQIVLKLNLHKQYANVMDRLPAHLVEKLIVDVPNELKRLDHEKCIRVSRLFLNVILNKLSSIPEDNKQAEDCVDQLNEHAHQIILGMTQMPCEQVRSLQADVIFQNMGYTVLAMFELLLKCDTSNYNMLKVTERLLDSCTSIVMAVTLKIFISWAELEEQNLNLQGVIAEKAYFVIERFKKYAPAKNLLSILPSIAKKPKTISELIRMADTKTIISMIDAVDQNQKQWFTAFLNNTQILEDPDSIRCLERWSHICNKEDVTRLLKRCLSTKDPRAKRVVMKCASNLSCEELAIVSLRHFRNNGINNKLSNEHVQQQVVILFNKIKEGSSRSFKEDFSKELHLLLLQDPEYVLSFIFTECLKNTFYTEHLKDVLPTINEIAYVNHIGMEIIKREIDKCVLAVPNEQDFKSRVELLNTLIETKFYTVEDIGLRVIYPILSKYLADQNYDILKRELEVLNALKEIVPLKEETENLYETLFLIMRDARCRFMNFDRLKQEVAKECVEALERCSSLNFNLPECTDIDIDLQDCLFLTYYTKKLLEKDMTLLLKRIYPNYESLNKSETVSRLIRYLPLCVTQEWLAICSELHLAFGTEKFMECIADCIVLLSHFMETQECQVKAQCMQSAIKYCVQNFGIVIKEIIQSRPQSMDEDVFVTKSVCRVLKDLPKQIKTEDGLSLANILTEASLKSLRTDKRFAKLLVSINEPLICNMLAQKVLGK